MKKENANLDIRFRKDQARNYFLEEINKMNQ